MFRPSTTNGVGEIARAYEMKPIPLILNSFRFMEKFDNIIYLGTTVIPSKMLL
jgi:hypothetical protein